MSPMAWSMLPGPGLVECQAVPHTWWSYSSNGQHGVAITVGKHRIQPNVNQILSYLIIQIIQELRKQPNHQKINQIIHELAPISMTLAPATPAERWNHWATARKPAAPCRVGSLLWCSWDRFLRSRECGCKLQPAMPGDTWKYPQCYGSYMGPLAMPSMYIPATV